MGTIQQDIYLLDHYPAAIIGFLLILGSAFLFVHVQFKMRSVGYKTYPLFTRPGDYALPLEYLKIRSQHGWSRWPVYLILPCFLLGFALVAIGMLRS
jgi:hypothetical protein